MIIAFAKVFILIGRLEYE